MNFRNLVPLAAMPAMLLAVEILALLLSHPFQAAGVAAFEDPTSVANPFIFLAILLLFTLFLLALIRFGVKRLIGAIIAISLFFTFLYVFEALVASLFPTDGLAGLAVLVLSVSATALLYRYPEWYVIDSLGILLAAGVASIFGISLAILPVLILLLLLAAYDAIAVYRTKHMITLAEGVLSQRAPILFVVPRRRGYSFIKEGVAIEEEERGAFIIGMGDLIMPSILVVSAQVFLKSGGALFTAPVLGAMAGSLAGLLFLLRAVGKGKPQAGLPPLNAGTIAGFLLGCLVSGQWAWLPVF
jgi:presenilin-like A22 family membrane protease